jgi:hypothetical protein
VNYTIDEARRRLLSWSKPRVFARTDDPFIVLSEVESGQGTKHVLFVNKNNIVWVEPEE